MPHTLMSRISTPTAPANVLRLVLTACLLFGAVGTAVGQQGDTTPPAENQSAADPRITLLPHSPTARWWVSGQDNIGSQWHPSFDAKYSGPNSFRTHAEHATSNIAT